MTAAFQNLQASSWGRMGVRRSWSVDRAGFVFGFIYHRESSRRHWNTAWPGSVEIQQSSKKEGAGKGRLFERSMGGRGSQSPNKERMGQVRVFEGSVGDSVEWG